MESIIHSSNDYRIVQTGFICFKIQKKFEIETEYFSRTEWLFIDSEGLPRNAKHLHFTATSLKEVNKKNNKTSNRIKNFKSWEIDYSD